MENKIYPMVRAVWQPLWMYYLGDKYGLGDNDGNPCQYNNSTFECCAYNWDEDAEQEYNFWHKPSGFKISWYKYALRGAWCNMNITDEQFVNILIDCKNSILQDNNVKLFYHCDKWWED